MREYVDEFREYVRSGNSDGSGLGQSMTRISGIMTESASGNKKWVTLGLGSNLQTAAPYMSPLLTELLKFHDNGVSLLCDCYEAHCTVLPPR